MRLGERHRGEMTRMLILSRKDVQESISMAEAIEVVRNAYIAIDSCTK